MEELAVYDSSDEDDKKKMNFDEGDLDIGGELLAQQSPKKKDYAVLSEADLRRRMEDAIAKVSAVLSVSNGESSILLREFKWNALKVTEKWFAGEEEVRKRAGLFKIPVPTQLQDESKEIACVMCSESRSIDGITGGNCVHRFCRGCLANMIGNQINDAIGSVTIRCPEPSCGAALNEDVIDSVATEKQRTDYSRFLLRNFVEHNESIKYCPSLGCSYAIDFDSSASSFDVCCLNCHSFCWNCLGEIHRPVDCNTVNEWLSTIFCPETRNENTLLMDTKPCPQCNRLIENSTEYNLMTCIPPCNYTFCWNCLDQYYNDLQGFEHACNEYNEARIQLEKQMESARKFYSCYDGWVDNEISKLNALSELDEARKTEGLRFLVEACEEIAKCRQFLKWYYVFRYFVPENNGDSKVQLFDIWKSQAEDALEKLESDTERKVRDFFQLRMTRKCFESFVRDLENDLLDIKSVSDTLDRKEEKD